MASSIHGYYTLYAQNGILYKEGLSEKVQTEAQKAKTLVASLLLHEAAAHAELQYRCGPTYVPFSPLNDSWFWFNMYHISSVSHFQPSIGGGGASCGSCSGGSGGGDGCAAVLLILAIIALAAAIFAALGFTVKHSAEAYKVEQKLHEVDQLRENAMRSSDYATAKDFKEVYETAGEILHEKYMDKTLKATFSATITVGLSFLTASAVLALYAVLNHNPFSPWVYTCAIAGGSIAGVGILAYCIRPIVHNLRQERLMKKYQELFERMKKLNPYLVHPYDVLQNLREEKVCFNLNGTYFAKNGQRYRASNRDSHWMRTM